MCHPLGERPDRPGGGPGREDQRPRKFSGGTPAETGLHRGDAATGDARAHIHANTHTHTYKAVNCFDLDKKCLIKCVRDHSRASRWLISAPVTLLCVGSHFQCDILATCSLINGALRTVTLQNTLFVSLRSKKHDECISFLIKY